MTTSLQVDLAQRVWRMCRMAARDVWISRAPSPGYVEAVAIMLYMVCCHESGGFKWRRQMGYLPGSSGGAFGLWQIQTAGVVSALAAIRRNEGLRVRCLHLLCEWGVMLPELSGVVLQRMQEPEGDALSCVVARVYHLLDPVSVPVDLDGIAGYCKAHHNWSGKATAALYRAAYDRWAPVAHPEWELN